MSLPSREYIIKNIKHKFYIRASILSFILAVWLLIDEKVKEGYFFNPVEVKNPAFHEFWVVVFLLISIISYAIHKKGGDKGARTRVDEG